MNFDFKKKGMDEAFTDEELEGMSGMQAMRDRVMRVTGRNPTVRDFLEVTRRGRPREAIVGSGKDVADRLEQWFTERACDGFVDRRHPHARRVRGFRALRRAGTAAARHLSQGLYRRDAAGESGPAASAARVVETAVT